MLFALRGGALSRGVVLLIATGLFSARGAVEEFTKSPSSQPKVAAASDEAEKAIKSMQLPQGFKAEVFAAEPHLANPVAFDIDHQNRFWVAETFRLHAGVSDIRGIMNWLDEDLASRSVSDRIAEMKRHLGDQFPEYEAKSDRVKLILDTDGDGKADRSTVFADGFNNAADGIGAGVLSYDGKVYYTDIPNLWMLQDKNGDGIADVKRSLSYGYGVRVGFLGHDLHGLIVGPDGRIYFSIGDRGSNIEMNGKHIGHPDTGCVFRCDPDGSNLEVFAYGLRNPQELAFDNYGNLFTGDNNSDGGDRARIVYVVEGGDSGWRVGFQFLTYPNSRGPWNSEKMWYPQNETQPEFLVPPIANLTDGPSGFAYYPGTGLPDQYHEHFFLADFHGARNSGIYTFSLKPSGAGFEIVKPERFIWSVLPTDVAFGPMGGIYFSDWVQGWEMTGKGRIYHVVEQDSVHQPIVAETRHLLMEGVKGKSISELQKLLAHSDMRVRQEAQFELVRRGKKGSDALEKAARSGSGFARLHAIWGLGQVARTLSVEQRDELARRVLRLAKDSDAEVRAQVARFIGEIHATNATAELEQLVRDDSSRVRMLAAISIGKLKEAALIPAVIQMTAQNQDNDPYLRHAASFALAEIGDLPTVEKAAKDPSMAVRMAALIAMRRMERPEIGVFLSDSDPKIVLEAARAINDVPVSGAMKELAALANSPQIASARPELLRRVVNANFRYGTRESASTLAALAANDAVPAQFRAEALHDLANWEHPSGRDPVTGLWRPMVGARPAKDAFDAAEPVIAKLIQNAPDAVRSAAAETAATLKIRSAAEALLASVKASGSSAPRVQALRALAALGDERLRAAIDVAQNDPSEDLRKEGLKFESKAKPSSAIAQIEAVLQNGTPGEKQSALGTLAGIQDPAADNILMAWMDKLLHGEVPANLQLDVLDAASKRENPALKSKVQAFEAQLAKGDPLAPWRLSMFGGNAADGKKIFFERAEAACVRCHKIAGQGSEGGEVGPELTHVGSQKDRAYILESIVFPNKEIARGFESVLVTTKDGTAYAGVLKNETAEEIVLNSPEDGIVKIKKANITSREKGLSAMPEGLAALLGRRDLRDLVEFLSSCK